jgi:hypothetical protein
MGPAQPSLVREPLDHSQGTKMLEMTQLLPGPLNGPAFPVFPP